MEEFPKGNLWHASVSEAVVAPPLDGDLDVELAVIGGG